jgi:hypothetical protein
MKYTEKEINYWMEQYQMESWIIEDRKKELKQRIKQAENGFIKEKLISPLCKSKNHIKEPLFALKEQLKQLEYEEPVEAIYHHSIGRYKMSEFAEIIKEELEKDKYKHLPKIKTNYY